MKKTLFILSILFLCGIAQATTRTAATCSAADITTQINLSTDGDTVLVPASASCSTLATATTWSAAINITKGITLNGQGAFIKMGSGGSLNVTSDAVANAVITGFNFNNGFTNGGCPIMLTSTPTTNLIRFTSNTYTDNGAAGTITELCTGNYGPVLIDNNTFSTTNGSDEIIHMLGPSNWSRDVVPGSSGMVYIETNTFKENHSAPDPCNAEQSYNGSAFVFRHNTLDYCSLDVHNGGNGGRWGEIYENQAIFPPASNNQGYGQIRGGSGLFYNNHVQSGPGNGVSVGPDCPGSSDTCSGTWPVVHQIGRGYNGSTYSPWYAWGNDAAVQNGISAASNQSLVVVGPSVNGCGAGHPGGVCDGVVVPTLPTLVKCQTAADVTAGCPVTYSYTALAYPYPLAAAPAFSASPSPVAFGNVNVGSSGGPTTVTITNTGSANLVIGSLSSSSGLFVISANGCNGQTVAAGSFCTFALTFSPVAAGSQSATITVPDNATNPDTITATGAGIASGPAVSLSASSLAFGIQVLNITSTGQAVTLTNAGNSSLAISSIALTGSTNFAISSNTCGSSLGAGSNCIVTVTFNPTSTGAKSGSLVFTTNATTSPDSVSLSGTGVTMQHIAGACSTTAAGSPLVNSLSWTCTPNRVGDAVVMFPVCHPLTGTVSSISVTATGWTINQLIPPVGAGQGTVGGLFGAIAPNTSSTTFTATFTGSGVTNCSSFATVLSDEFEGNNQTSPFNATGSSGGLSGGCNQAAANVTPPQNNETVWFGCLDFATGVTSPWTLGVDDSNQNLSEYQVLTGGSGVAKTPAYTSSSFYIVMGAAITPNSGTVAATPTLSPLAGSYNTFQNISISDTSSGAIICFNVSGSPATNGATGCAPNSALYTAPFQLSATTTVFAVAGGTGFSDSAIASITYTINPTAQLPAVKVNNTEYIGTTTNTINFPNAWTCGVTNFGPYANTCAGLQVASNNAETCRATNGSGTKVKIPHGSALSGGASCLTLNQTAGDTSTNFIVFDSDTPLPLGQTVCSHGIQDNVSRSTQTGLRNLGCDGSHISYQLGTTITPVNYALDTLVSTGATAITLANGTVTNTSAYNDKASMYHLQCTTVNCSVIITGAPDATTNCSGGPCSPHHYAILNGEFNPIGGTAGTIIAYDAAIQIGTQTENTIAKLPNHIHIGYSYIHGDIGDAPLDPITQLATGGPNGSTAMANGVAFLGCTNCSLVYSYLDQLLRPSNGITNSEGHTVYFGYAGQIKTVHNWGEGSAIGLFSGGWAFTAILPNESGADIEDRASRWTYPYSWTLARDAGFCYNNLSCPIGNAANTYGRKNAHESKIANRWLTDGDILEHSDNSGGQSGIIKSIKVESCCEAYTMSNQNHTFTNNILRDGCEGGSWGFRSSGPGSGGAASLPTQIALWQNNLTYDIAGGNPACSGSVSMGFRISNNISQTWPNSTCTRDSAGLTATCTLPAFAGNNQSDMNIGDPVTIANCVDTTFNTNQNILNPALPGTTPTGLAIVYANAGTANATTTGCLFDYSVGWPRYLIYNHNSEFNKPTTAIDPYFVGPGASTANQMFSRNLTFTNGIFYGGGIFASGFSEGLKVFQIPAGEVDAGSFTFNHDYFADRDARASCPGHGAGANGIAQCYIEYSSAHAAIQPPVTISGIPTASGDFYGSASLPVLNDWHDYRLCHGEAFCGSVTSPFAAGQASQATDGTDLGFAYAAIDAAQTSIQYPAPGFFPDAPTAIPATLFGLHWKISNFPPLVNSGAVRLWDSLTRWQLLNTANGVYSFTNLDTNLQDAKTLGVDVLFTLSTTPNFTLGAGNISSDPTNATCNYNSTATGGCGVPTDIAISCTNVNGAHNCDGKVDGTNQTWRNFIYNMANHIAGLNTATYQIPSAYEIWNEASQQGTSGAGTCAQIGGTSWEGTCAQMVRMYSDANCIMTGRGVGCSAGSMGVPAVGIFPAAIVTSPSSVMTAPESNWYGAYLLTSGATTNLDIAAIHGYTQGGSCCAQPETIITRYATALAKTSAASFTGPIWSTEGGWGQVASEPDVDLQAAFVPRYYILCWSSGFQRCYWYSYDSLFGTLWTSGVGLTKAGVAYNQAYAFLVGATLTVPASSVGTVWSANFSKNGQNYLVMWDTSQTCSGGSCTTANQTVSSTWLTYQDMTFPSNQQVIPPTHVVPVGAKPIILQSNTITRSAPVNPILLGGN